MDKALLVGINAYPGAPLRGCINDVTDLAEYLTLQMKFPVESVRLLVDGRATTDAILDRARWLVKDLRPADRVVFGYSGHGTQVAERNANDEVDHLDEVICPVDFDWTDAHMIIDNDLQEIFSRIPEGVTFTWLADCCHSGDLTRGMPMAAAVSKYMPPPADIRWRNLTAASKQVKKRQFAQSEATPFRGVFISGCRSDQTSADTVIDGRPCGAMTHFLLRSLRNNPGSPMKTVTDNMVTLLQRSGFSQVPQAYGDRLGHPFLG